MLKTFLNKYRELFFLSLLLLALLTILAFAQGAQYNNGSGIPIHQPQILSVRPSPTPTPFQTYTPPQLPAKDAYTVILVGDSMIKSLGPNSDQLRKHLADYYPDTVFGIFNYGYGSTSIATLDERLHQTTSNDEGTSMPAILDRQFDIIIIESFAYNPMSDLSPEQGTQKQTEILTQTVTSIIRTHPESLIIFLTAIAPNSDYYGRGVIDLSSEVRRQWVDERKAYLQNHIDFTNQHNIPLINVYQVSQNDQGEGDLTYINPGDYIHPSAAGVDLLSRMIADYLHQNQIIQIFNP